MTVKKKVAKNPMFLQNLNFFQPNLMVEFFGFPPVGPKTKADTLNRKKLTKTRSTRNQRCVKYRGIIIYI